MRVTSMVAGLALAVAACGGENAGNQATTTDTAAAAAPAAAPAATGTTHNVDMVLADGQYRFVPAELTVKAGDVIQYHNRSGGPHNVAFWADSIPAGGAEAIQIVDQMAPLTSQMVVEQDAVITVNVAASAPTGEYRFTCQPHSAMGMHGKVTVQ
jgi:plastocyanin